MGVSTRRTASMTATAPATSRGSRRFRSSQVRVTRSGKRLSVATATEFRRRRWVVIQFVAHVSPPSRENACSNRGSVGSANQE